MRSDYELKYAVQNYIEPSFNSVHISPREKRCLDFALKCIKHPRNKRLFNLNTRTNGHTFIPSKLVNWARTSSYQKSAIPFRGY